MPPTIQPDAILDEPRQQLAIAVLHGAALELAAGGFCKPSTPRAARRAERAANMQSVLRFLEDPQPWASVLGMDAEDVMEKIVKPIMEGKKKPRRTGSSPHTVGQSVELTKERLEGAARMYSTSAAAARALNVVTSSLRRAMVREGVEWPQKWRKAGQAQAH